MGTFFPENSTFSFCETVSFVEFKKVFFVDVREKQIARTPAEWFELLRAQGARGLRLVYGEQNVPGISDRMSSGFVGGGGVWQIEAVLRSGKSAYWRSRWEVGDRNAADRRIWRVAYGKVSEGQSTEGAIESIDELSDKLRAALRDVREFSCANNCGGFTEWFGRALSAFDASSSSLVGFHKDLAPEGILSPSAFRLLDGCQCAWVFGGMGSWNDIYFEGDLGRQYERVSENLFSSLTKAIAAAASNSYAEN